MANLTIRNLDDRTVETLKSRAKDHNRSLEGELRQILKDAVRPSTSVNLRDIAESIAAMTINTAQTDSVDLLHEDRRR